MSIYSVESATGELDESIFDYPRRFETNHGKFLRMGELVIVGPFILGLHSLLHRELLNRAMDTDLFDRFWAEEASEMHQQALRSPGQLKDPHLMDDVGRFTVATISDTERSVHVTMSSTVYGKANLSGRLLTGEVFQRQLGENTIVTADLKTQ